MTLDPHDLINLPGYGNAEKQLRKAGMWDDDLTTMLQNYLQDALSAIEIAHLASMKLKEAAE
jgi:GTP-binding protein EngB required for normal cell division